MDSEYDRKFEEMKKYIPFLESMIKRLENTNSKSNPRQAQLDKIRSLRDLLMDKKKRMKMENLLKCEQVLVNLYEKVEQRDSLPIPKKDGNTQKKEGDLNAVRHKLKSAVTKLHKESIETLPEIARASETEAVCVPGSKEPALFQRRPNKSSMSPTRPHTNKIKEPSPQMSKRNYTRVLLSPEPAQIAWCGDENSTENLLFSRRSPKNSPRLRSPTYYRKERKKAVNNKTGQTDSKDLNITLKVPEESLNSLNTKDILSRIINCSDNDVDIDTLRELRTQILGELKDTGNSEDISDLILKSYKKKGTTASRPSEKTKEVEEGELSDSESEAIESIYGSLVIMDKDKLSINTSNKLANDETPRKIQICLVINSDKNKSAPTKEEHDKILPIDTSDFETYCNEKQSSENEKGAIRNDYENNITIEGNKPSIGHEQHIPVTVDDQEIMIDLKKDNEEVRLGKENEKEETAEVEMKKETDFLEPKEIKPNFYKPIVEQNKDCSKYVCDDKSSSNVSLPYEESNADICGNIKISTENSNVEIPLLEQTKKVSEIDILQALKKEILSETNNVLRSEAVTPALHQPKITKVANANEIGSKKRISIENYKAKTNAPLKNILGNEISSSMNKDDLSKKLLTTSLKLTEKECERFNFSSKLTLDGSSDDEDRSIFSVDEVYDNLVPKSPDHEDFADAGIKPPVIIPSDPVQRTIVSSETDVDMRKNLPILQSNPEVRNALTSSENMQKSFTIDRDKMQNNDKITSTLVDPRMKKDINMPESPNPYMISVDKTPRTALNYVNPTGNLNLLQNINPNLPLPLNVNIANNRNIISPNMPANAMPIITPNIISNLGPSMTPIRTPNVPNMTPNSRSFDMTPSRQTFDNEDFLNQKHVYAPMFPIADARDHSEKQWDSPDSNRLPFWEDPRSNSNQRDVDYRDSRNMSFKRDNNYRDGRDNSLQRDNEYNPAFDQYQNSPRNDRFNFDKIDPNHRMECPPTPNISFGRLDCPATPTSSFGRLDAPMTPVHPFGRLECPSTPNHPFGRPEPLLSLPFVRPDFNQPVTSQVYGKPLDPRLNRNSDYDNYHNRDDDRDRSFFHDPKFNANSYKSDHNNRNNNPDSYRRFQREQSVGRNDRNKNYDNGRNYRESRREASVVRYNRDYDNDRSHNRNRGSNRSYDYRHQNDFKNYDESDRRSNQREKSISWTTSHSSTRDLSVGKTFSRENQFHRRASPSFTIDTSIHTTFQENKNKNSFDARRQRAASVGRNLGRGSSPIKSNNRDLKHMFNHSEIKNNCRRACSVGREIIDSKLDFKEIKADLKSFKLKGESRWNKEITNNEESKKTRKVMKYRDPRSRKEQHKTNIETNQSNVKYSPRKNCRDPRMRRENSYENKSNYRDNYRSKSKDSKSYGIVYSNDNITKGTILGPGYGVKNYKIPKIKRPQETEQKTEDGEIKSKDNANIEVDNKVPENKKVLIKKVTDKKENTTRKKNALDSTTSIDNEVEEMKSLKQSKESKSNIDQLEVMKGVVTEKNKDKVFQNIIQNDNYGLKTTSSSCKKQEVENENNLDDVKKDSVDDNVEKRITRSASKSLSLDSSIDISPVKRTRRGKKPFVYESDSDDYDKKNKETFVDNAQSNQDLNNKTTDDIPPDNSDESRNIKTLDTKKVLINSFEKPIDKKVESNSDPDTGFGMDDLKIFADNITSDPVLDNINALIADLDHDLDSSKNVDTKSNFTRELTLETMLENITSPEDNDMKQDTLDELSENLDTKMKGKVISKSESNNLNTFMLESDENKSKLDLVSETSASLNESEMKTLDIIISCESINKIDRKIETVKVLENEDIHNSEAIVSTSGDGEKNNFESQQLEEKKVNTEIKPDSTINSNITSDSLESQRNIPDSTNELNSEMNSVISSTHTTSDTTNSKIISEPKEVLKKIKELLSLLGDQSSDNEKIKKKLEKLSELVSDDEENTIKEKEPEVEISYPSEKKINETDNLPTILLQEKEIDVAKQDNNDLELIKPEDNKDVNVEEKKNNDEEIMSETNKKSTEIINDEVLRDKEENIPFESVMPENKIVDLDNDVLCSKETQVTTKKNKNIVSRRGKRKNMNKVTPNEERRLTRSDAANRKVFDKPVVKKPSRELQKLQDDIREMFIRDDILSATGIRMCRLAKLVNETKSQKDEPSNENSNQEPVVVLEKCNDINIPEDSNTDKFIKKKSTKGKRKGMELETPVDLDKYPKNKNLTVKVASSSATSVKIKQKENNDDVDPYVFETDSINETNNTSDRKVDDKNSESENESLVSSKSFESTELLAEVKKKVKRKRVSKGWQAGIIKPKNKKKKVDRKSDSAMSNDDSVEIEKKIEIPDYNCFTDKSYCFSKNLTSYDCRLCAYNGVDIVYHYKKHHPHSEIPLSRMSPDIANQAIKEAEKIDFQAVSKISSKKYICRFCCKEFGRKKPVLELFFWHVVSHHTGEYKQLCSECLNVTRCPFRLDIPPPPKDNKGQLLGYVCEKCNYTQVSLENLKTHVIIRHNDEQTAVYTINLSVTAKSIMNNYLTEVEEIDTENQLPRVLRSSRSNQSIEEMSDVKRDSTEESSRNLENRSTKSSQKEKVTEIEKVIKSTKFQSKITFENDHTDEILNFDHNESSRIKLEPEFNETQDDSHFDNFQFESDQQTEEFDAPSNSEKIGDSNTSNDIFNYPHFKIKYSDSGSKEYICCINGKDLHYRTTLLISFKKHVQLKHSENWDGYCFICKVIVTPQGVHLFKDCLQHFLDQHIDNFPVLEEISEQVLSQNVRDSDISNGENVTNKPYINVRPLSELISKSSSSQSPDESPPTLPVIESVISLGTGIEQPRPSPTYPKTDTVEVAKQYRHEEAQAEIMSRKHRVVLDAMMSQVKLIQVFKCAGRFCSFTTDSAEDALLHASTHTRVGGEDSLKCVYCDFDSSSNAIDLITHVFKSHGCCQYVCGMCFYRAAASQLVNAHIKRAHENATVSILHTALQTAPIKEDNILTRESAVPYYLCCASSGSDTACKFRTYTPGKFCEHLMTRHASATEHSCFMCSVTLSSPADLIRHLKTHGLKLYQCTWCVFGADNETELLAHASANHPDKQPKAYLRIITNKEGTSEFRVLPLAHLNKSDIPAVEVKSSSFKENPVREAERSIELEKLIGHTTLMIESMAAGETEATERELTSTDTDKKTSDPPLLENMSLFEEKLTQRATTPISLSQTSLENQLTPIIKTESVEIIRDKSLNDSVIYCLDSEEEDASQNVIDLPNDRSSSKNVGSTEEVVPSVPKLLPLTQLFVCAKCKMVMKYPAGFKKHIMACYSLITDPIPCAHCSAKVVKKNILTHYTKTHAEINRYDCSKCSNKFTTLAQAREHERNFHVICSDIPNVDNSSVANAKTITYGRRKRPLVNKENTTEPPEKLKRFGPQDVNLLPINPILDDSVFCSLCEFSTKVRLNMVRHLQLHAEQQIVSQTAPVNPVPHLETNEKHFDKMLNLASSSIVSRTPEKNKGDGNKTITVMIPPEALSRYPKYVPERHRHTCGAKGCSYISVDESMFKCHWETLHSGTGDYHCVHCPPHQQLDTTNPLTAVRIIAHLKMHDTTLYACSLCSYYHYKRQIVENHLFDIHKSGQVMVVREEANAIPVNTSQAQISAPTMDLKPWLCGLCKFKSLLRPEVVDHCAKVHNSKMQYKCAYCAFRTSNSENITKHQNKSHPEKKEEIFYYYYREGSLPENSDGTPLWQRQSQKCDVTEPKIKSEVPSDVSPTPKVSLPLSNPSLTEVDLNLVKKEVIESAEDTIEDLCKAFGEFCEPNGLKYKCPFCKNVVEDNTDAMQSHLYEEVKYRKWGCSICSYKAFHKAGLSDHMQTEHRQNKEPIALQTDIRVETWVTKLLEYQTDVIQKNKENLAKQKEEILRSAPGPSRPKSSSKPISEDNQINQSSSNNNASNKLTMAELESLFGSLGVSVNMSFCCPKCHSTFKDADVMKNHLESELNKIRWLCNKCTVTFQTYHEAQFHCRSVHQGQSSRPMEATRCPNIRSAWVEAVIRVQKLSMNYVPLPPKSSEADIEPTEAQTEIPENSLLVVRYEERIQTPEEQMARKTPLLNPDSSDDDKLVIDEPLESRKQRNCPHCEYSSVNARVLRNHILRHYNLKPFQCAYCGITGSKTILEQHQKFVHYNQSINLISTQIPTEPLSEYLQNQSVINSVDTTKNICLVCRNSFTEAEMLTHCHNKVVTTFGKKGEVVVKCSICDTLHKDVNAYFNHHKSCHGSMSVNYVFTKLTTMSNEPKALLYACSSCDQKFCHLKDLKVHADSNHGSNLKYTIVSKHESLPNDEIINLDEEENVGTKRNSRNVLDSPSKKKVAKKSTTKLPFNKPFARKSTTKLPFNTRTESEEFSYYGTRPSTDGLDGVTTKMSFCNTMVPFTLKKLNEIININPIVKVKKLK